LYISYHDIYKLPLQRTGTHLVINMAEAIVDEVVTKLLTEAAEKVLKEEE
jgi:hypothetical protein